MNALVDRIHLKVKDILLKTSPGKTYMYWLGLVDPHIPMADLPLKTQVHWTKSLDHDTPQNMYMEAKVNWKVVYKPHVYVHVHVHVYMYVPDVHCTRARARVRVRVQWVP